MGPSFFSILQNLPYSLTDFNTFNHYFVSVLTCHANIITIEVCPTPTLGFNYTESLLVVFTLLLVYDKSFIQLNL